jgi:hypothetical protein
VEDSVKAVDEVWAVETAEGTEAEVAVEDAEGAKQ